MALAFVLSWLSVAGDRQSVLPGWVWRQFSKAQEFAATFRDVNCGAPSCAWCREQFDARALLRKWFPGFSDFRVDDDGRSRQREIVETALAGKSLMAILPTGGGKSLCYQLPALARMERRGMLTIVISPLQSLMKDQVDQLAKHVPAAAGCAAALNSSLPPLERREVLHRIAMGDIGLLFVAPEQLRNRSFGQAIRQREIGAWVFDEAHCVSKWGHDFRTDYFYTERFIREFYEKMGLPVPPVMYVTATAKPEVMGEIRDFHERMTGSRDLPLFEASVERPGLQFEVVKVAAGERLHKILDILTERLGADGKGGAIVFRSTRAKARETAEFLKNAGRNAAHFHAKLSPEEKKDVQNRFIGGDLQIIAATNAFGMGVDKADVRVVIHGDMPGSVESYLQEAGRAGRDRQLADCILLFDENDADWQFNINGMNRLSRREIAEILRALRRYKRKDDKPIVVTVGELMRDTRLQEVFEPEDPGLNTKMKTAISWLERAEYLKRDDNVTSVFQAKPIAKTRQEAEQKAEELGHPPERQKLWGDILNEFVFARADAGIDTDRLVSQVSLKMWCAMQPGRRELDRVLFDELRAMAKAGVLRECTAMTAYVRHKVSDPSHLRMERLARVEAQMLDLLAEQGAESEKDLVLDVALVNQRLKDDGRHEAELQDLGPMAMALGGLELHGARLMEIRPGNATRYRVTLRAEMLAVKEAATLRREVASTVLKTILSQIPTDTLANKDVLSEFTMEQLCEAVDSELLLQAKKLNTTNAIEHALLWLHDLQIIRMQRGLALFRTAMTIHVDAKNTRLYGIKEYETLGLYYEEKTFQVHVMLEYAQLGMKKSIQAALELVLDYFRFDQKQFIERYFPGRKKEIERAATAEAYRHIVEELGDDEQRCVVEAPEEENLLVLAGPGSGKTKAVVHRIAWLLKIRQVPAHSILALCFNHEAAVQLRQRLRELAGDSARGVTVMTYHGLAMRLTGTSFSALAACADTGRRSGGEKDFDQPICEAICILKGEKVADASERDEARDRLLAGFHYILVDEYQDVNKVQYELISALAGRMKDPDAKLGLLAVGDDDQSIYAFRGADVRFIEKFKEDYKAEIYDLTSNYRSSRAILDASGHVIAGNLNRMKADKPLHVNQRRQNDPPGDPVRRIEAENLAEQSVAVLRQAKAWHVAGAEWKDIAVLGVYHEDLDAFRSAAEADGVPVNVRWTSADPEKGGGLPPLWRMRDCTMLLDKLKAKAGKPVSRSRLQSALEDIRASCGESVWLDLLVAALTDFPEDEAVAEDWIEHIYETLAGCRRDGRVGRDGIWLSTIHAAKGTEHGHVAVAGCWGGPWKKYGWEESRRLLYVGMTRAKRRLAVVDRLDDRCELLQSLRTQFGMDRVAAVKSGVLLPLKQYRLLGPADFDLGFAGRGDPDRVRKIAAALRNLKPGHRLEWLAQRTGVKLKTGGCAVAMLSQAATQLFCEQADRVEDVRVLGVYAWRKEDGAPEWRGTCIVDQWGVPLCEVVLRR